MGGALPPSVVQILRSQWDRALAWAAVTGALVLLVVGYRQVSYAPFASDEVASVISAGGGALLLIVTAIGLLISADLKDGHHKLHRIEAAVRGAPEPPAQVVLSGGPAPVDGDGRSDARVGSRPAALVAGGGLIVGSVVLGAGWSTAANTGELDQALDAIPVAMVGLAIAAAGFVFYTVWLRLTLTQRLRRVLVVRPCVAGISPEPQVGDGGRWMVTDLPLVHRSSCPTLTFAQGDRTRVTVVPADTPPCRLCEAGG